MDIRHLKMIREVAKHGNLTKAAEYLYVSQSALSHQLKEMEEYYNAQIFIRQKKQMLLTPVGQVILDSSERIIVEMENTSNHVRYLIDKNAGQIRVSTECYTSYHWLANFLSEFKEIYPKVEVMIDADATHNCVKALFENRIDIGIIEDNLNKKLGSFPLFKDEFFAVVANNHPWTKLKWVNDEHFFEENYIMYNVPTQSSTVYQKLFQTGEPKKVYKIALTEAIVQMVKAGLGVAVLPHWIVTPFVSTGEISVVPLSRKGMKRTWYAAVLKNRQLAPYMNAFIKNLSKHLKNSEEHDTKPKLINPIRN